MSTAPKEYDTPPPNPNVKLSKKKKTKLKKKARLQAELEKEIELFGAENENLNLNGAGDSVEAEGDSDGHHDDEATEFKVNSVTTDSPIELLIENIKISDNNASVPESESVVKNEDQELLEHNLPSEHEDELPTSNSEQDDCKKGKTYRIVIYVCKDKEFCDCKKKFIWVGEGEEQL